MDPKSLAASLKACAGQGNPVSAAVKSRGPGVFRLPGRPRSPRRNPRALGVRHRPRPSGCAGPGPLPLIATKSWIRACGRTGKGGGRGQDDPAWPYIAAGAIALAAASALDLAADLARRADTLFAVAPKLRAKPAQKIVDLLLAQDCVSPAEAARHAPMTGRAARRLFDRLVLLGAAREFSERPTFRLYGL